MENDITTLEQYLQGLVSMINVPAESIRSLLIQCNMASGLDVNMLDEKTRDLITARFYVWCATTMPYSKNNTDDSDGGWKHTEGGYQMITDQLKWMLRQAKGLYRKWGMPLPPEFPRTGLTVFNF